MIPNIYEFWRFLTPEYQGKIYQPPDLATGRGVARIQKKYLKFHGSF